MLLKLCYYMQLKSLQLLLPAQIQYKIVKQFKMDN